MYGDSNASEVLSWRSPGATNGRSSPTVEVISPAFLSSSVAGRTLTDDEAADRLARASAALGDEPGETVAGDTALQAARRAVTLIMLGLEQASEQGSETVPGVLDPTSDAAEKQ
jgi:hypothetical protein